MQKTQKSEKTITFYVKNCKKEQCCFVFVVFLAFLTSKSEKATAAEEKNTIILQILLGNRIWSRARARPSKNWKNVGFTTLLGTFIENPCAKRNKKATKLKTIGLLCFC